MNRRRPEEFQCCTVLRARVSLVRVEGVPREVRSGLAHDPVSCYLRNYRRRRDAERYGIALHDRGRVYRADEIPGSVDERVLHFEVEAFDSASRAQSLRSRHAHRVALGRRHVPDRPRNRPLLDSIDECFTLWLGELLGVPDLVDSSVLGDDYRADREGTRPRSPPHFVDADDHVAPPRPQGSLVGDSGRVTHE